MKQVVQLPLQGGLLMAKSGKRNWETIFTDNIGLHSTTVTYLASKLSKAIEFGEKTQNKGNYAVQGHSRYRGRYQSKARM